MEYKEELAMINNFSIWRLKVYKIKDRYYNFDNSQFVTVDDTIDNVYLDFLLIFKIVDSNRNYPDTKEMLEGTYRLLTSMYKKQSL